MDRELILNAKQLNKRRQRKKLWQRAVSILGCIVVFCTTYALILPAITQEREAFCGLEEHTHGENCYSQVTQKHLTCTPESLGLHVHSPDCYNAGGLLSCGQADFVVHTHNEACYDSTGTLVCLLPEREAHIHSEECYILQGGHSHGEECYKVTRGSLVCRETEDPGHTHGQSCYTAGEKLLCTQEENHLHGEACYAPGALQCIWKENHVHGEGCTGNVLKCTLPQDESHTHDAACYETQIICENPENHTHGADCYEKLTVCTIPEGHTHGASCYEQVLQCQTPETPGHTHGDECYEQLRELICTLEEAPGQKLLACTQPEAQVHVHGDACFQTVEAPLTCTVEAGEDHTHGAMCYGTWELVCTMKEHTHSLICYSNPEADVETAEDWEKTLADIKLTGRWAEDVLAIAESQLGYKESTSNYIVEEGEVLKGYTRYGAWYGIPYGDWCAMYASFCLQYAGVEGIPAEASVSRWIALLSEEEYDLYKPAGAYVPQPGDLVFFDWEQDGDPDHVGFVAELLEATQTEPLKIKTIEGNSGNTVRHVTYEMSDPDILGFATLPWQPSAQEQAQIDAVIAQIDAMPSADEIDAQILTLEKAGNDEAADQWYAETVRQVCDAYVAYESLSPQQKEKIINRDILLELEYIWSAVALAMESGYTCGYQPHTHSAEAGCFDESGELMCKYPVHTHDSSCLTEGTWYCGKTAHAHGPGCYDADSALTCVRYVHIHSAACEAEPEDTTHAQGSGLGAYYHMEQPSYYQASSQRVDTHRAYSFVLVDDDAAKDSGWQLEPVDWTAKTDANYLVVYCAEPYTATSQIGGEYRSFVINNSRFTDDAQRRALAGVIAHGYPYITYAQMKAELAEAYAAGELSHDIANCPSCTENEYMVAVQAAIWALIDGSSGYDAFDSTTPIAASEEYINQFPEGYIGHSAGDAQLNVHCLEIRNWLMRPSVPEDLAVVSYDYAVTEDSYGTYALTVNAEFNRPIISGEQAALQLLAGEGATQQQVLETGEVGFTLRLENLTEEELASASVSLLVSGERQQAYFFDSELYQDMIGGLWEEYENDISFRINEETTSFSVTKQWAGGKPEDISSVTVQLYADGNPCGEPVELSDVNNWHYVWTDLIKENVLGSEITYTIQEMQIDGFYATVEAVEETNFVITEKVWVQADGFREGGEYLIVSSDGALGAHLFEDSPGLTWEAAQLSDPENTPEKLIWKVSSLNEESGAVLANSAYPDNPLGLTSADHYVFPEGTQEAVRTDVYYSDNRLYMLDAENNRRYFTALYLSGQYRTAEEADAATEITLYELQHVQSPDAQIHFILTNTMAEEETTTLTVTKSWAGRPDEAYPDQATVSLTQNGRAYGTQVVLSAENDWKYVWENLPVADNEGNPFSYAVAEVSIDSYSTASEVNMDPSGAYFVELVNTWTPVEVQIELQKADSNTGARLSGAEFDVYWVTEGTGEQIPGVNGLNGVLVDSVTVGEAGAMLNLAVGETYYLVEMKAPEGYLLLKTPVGITVSRKGTMVSLSLIAGEDWAEAVPDTTAVLTVSNKAGFTLPKTGGPGTLMYTMAGAVMSIASFCLLYRQNKRRKEGNDP